MRKSSGSFKTAANGAHMHRLRDTSPSENSGNSVKTSAPIAPQKPLEPLELIQRRHAVYLKLISKCLELNQQHRAALRLRGLSDEAINRSGYVSTGWTLYADDIERAMQPYDLSGVAGFYKEGHTWRLVDAPPGFLVPVRDTASRISGLMIRRDGVTGSGKYVWLSSVNRPEGTTSGAPVHFAKPELIEHADELIITEGALKADVIAHLSNMPVAGVAGVSTFGATFAASLRRRFASLRNIVIAYDRDMLENEHVYGALRRLTAQLERERFQVRIRTWPDPHKGYDDFLLANLRNEEVAN
jgi:hypothetical protein